MDNIIRVSVSEAARLFGVSSKTIRQAIRNEEIKYIVETRLEKVYSKKISEESCIS